VTLDRNSTALGAEPFDWRDVAWILLWVALLIASGYGFRDPWPADEPRFASLARDMVASGNWIIPRVGGDLYQDKPPVYFWLLAASYALIGSVRWSFLLPSLLASCVTSLLVYDLGRRLYGRRAGLCAALLLASSLQFVITMRGAQIDPTLLMFSMLSVWAFCRHLLLGPHWRAYFLGGLAAGVGVVTKGVGFLPLLLIPLFFAVRRARFSGLAQISAGGARWWLAPRGFMLGVGVWLVPMLLTVQVSGSAELIAYRNEILVQQTVQRYAKSWHHVKNWYYFVVEVIPPLWLPLSALLFWLVPRWWRDWQARRADIALLLGWVLLVLLFFSASPGKRGVYLLPALPVAALAAAAYLPGLFEKRSIARLSLGLAALLVVPGLIAAAAALLGEPRITSILTEGGVGSFTPLLLFAVAALLAWIGCAIWRPLLAWPAVLACLALCWGYGMAPQLNPVRTTSAFMAGALAQVPADVELGLVAYKEQFLLYVDRESVNFGHRRWLEGPQEAYDAARWLSAQPNRMLLVPATMLAPCFAAASKRPAGTASREIWWLVNGIPAQSCVNLGDASRAIRYPAHRIG
jgi:4-amino-4-deoxy-L-arabinose transferase-like glycosyltransferase